jgi:hypothetical protein
MSHLFPHKPNWGETVVWKEIVERVRADPRYKTNIEYGSPRPGHPEGKVKNHISELDENLEKLKSRLPNPEYYWKLRFLIHVHDTFKAKSRRNASILDPHNHASLARSFASEFTDDEDLLNMILLHDQNYALWKQFRNKGNYNQQDFQDLLNTIKDWDLFLIFLIIDGSTRGKDRSKLIWFINEAGKHIETFIDESWVLHPSDRIASRENETAMHQTIYPAYSYPLMTIAELVRDVVVLRSRVFQEDANACISRLVPPLRLIGQENIPMNGRYVITVNHYYRRGFAAQWLAIAISSVIHFNVHWMITGELTYPGKWYAPFGTAASRFILKRGARIYGFTTMPPMPPRPRDVDARAASVRKVLEYVRETKDAVVGFAPEGGDQMGGRLSMPAPGVGRFALLLAAQGFRFEPVGIYESDGELCLNFGRTYDLVVERNISPVEKDKRAARRMMENIAILLPLHLRGEFV